MSGPSRARIDHVGFAARELAPVARILRDRYGLGVEAFPDGGGGHVPLADHQYIEIHTAEPGTPLREWIAKITQRGNRWWAWSIEVPDFDRVVDAHGLVPRTFRAEEGTAFSAWSGRHAGTEEIGRTRGFLPYFIDYDQEPQELAAIFAGKLTAARHDRMVGGLASVSVGGSQEVLDQWVGGRLTGARTDPAQIGVTGVRVGLDGAEVDLVLE